MQDVAVTAYDVKAYRLRRAGVYQKFRRQLVEWDRCGSSELLRLQEQRLSEFLAYASSSSPWYARLRARQLSDYPVLTKDDLVRSGDDIATRGRGRRVISFTGGTTGASLKVHYQERDVQERTAFLDHFRARYGYELGKRVAWFSGKDIATSRDVRRGRCYRDDKVHDIRYFSTFHINDANAEVYWKKLLEFSPEYVVGFPSSVYQICRWALENGLELPMCVEAYFPTAETLLQEHRDVIGGALQCQVRDQYASSEGAPFIFECQEGRMHMHPLSGVFEVVDRDLQPAMEGELLVTSFSTRGTPLIRYRVGDRMKLAPPEERCTCGSFNGIVESIEGRSSDFVWSPSVGRINLGNLSNCTKGISGIRRFQVIQEQPTSILVKVVAGLEFGNQERVAFIKAIQARTGEDLRIEMQCVDEIPVASSGKYQIVVNRLSMSDIT